jgi:hypothetical protein
MMKVEANLKQYNARLLVMRGKASEIQADMKEEYLSQIESLEEKLAEYKVKLGPLKIASEHAWEDLKTGAEKAWHEVDDAIEKAVSRFKE